MAQTKPLQDYYKGLPFEMPRLEEPSFPACTVSIADYGAVPDGHTLNTKSFSDAITACAKAGGGTVIIPPGTWLTGPIQLESNINLHIEKGALVQFSSRLEDNPFVQQPKGVKKYDKKGSLISAYKAKNIAITGDGIFDGGGEAWRYVLKEDMNEKEWKALIASGGIVTDGGSAWWPSEEAWKTDQLIQKDSKKKFTNEELEQTKEYFRPNLVVLTECKNVLLDGPTFQNSPRYHVVPRQCENVIIRNISVLAPAYGKNTDAIDPSACRNVIIYNCTIDTGDDGICLKPGDIADSQTPGPACMNYIIADCVVYHAHGGFVIGSESNGGVRNIFVSNCVFAGTEVGLRFKSLRGKGGLVEKIYIQNIQMRNIVTDAILFDMYYSGNAPDVEARKDLTIRKAEPLTAKTPKFQDFYVKNVVCKGADRAVVINGLPEMPIKNMNLDNVSIESKRGAFIADADSVTLHNCRIVPASSPVVTVISSTNVAVTNGQYPAAADVFIKVIGEKSNNIRLTGIDVSSAKKISELVGNSKPNAVIIEK
jgi:DNA sulfur modification protein DndE